MYKKRLFVVLGILVSFILGIMAQRIYEVIRFSNILDSRDTNLAFEKIQELIQDELKVQGYETLFARNETFDVAVPGEIAGNKEAEYLYKNHRQYIFKNKEKAIVIVLDISRNDIETQGRRWTHSMGYNPVIHNSTQIERYEKLYDEVYPKSQVYQYSFREQGYNLSVIGISEIYGDDNMHTLGEIINFTVKLNDLLRTKGI